MELQTLTVHPREAVGKSGAAKVRRKGLVPATLYGENQAPLNIEMDLKNFNRLVHGRGGAHAIVQVDVEGKPELNTPAVIKSVEHHPLRGTITHADLFRIRLDKRIRTVVPIALKGQPKGVVDGGVLDHALRELEVECMALQIPDFIEVNVSELALGAILHVNQIQVPTELTVLTASDRTVATVHAPRAPKEAEAEVVTEEAAAAAAPGAAPAGAAATGKTPAGAATTGKTPADKGEKGKK